MIPAPFSPLRSLPALCAALLLAASGAWSQVSWTTTKTTNGTRNTGSVALLDGKLRVKVFPAYLDVEEELTLQTQGSVAAANDASTLEITGTFSLPAGAVVTGALLWDGPRVLQAKLLDNNKADSIYEDLVDRDSVPPARPIDPLILSRVSPNRYLVKVYPVALNGSRRFRLRYQLPPRIGADGFEIRMQGALTPLFSGAQTIFTTLEAGPGTSTIGYAEGGIKREMTLPRTLFVARGSLAADAPATTALRILPVNPLRQVQVKTSFDAGPFQGHYLNLYASPDSTLLSALGQRIEVVVFWKWHNPRHWNKEGAWTFRYEAENQAQILHNMYANLGLPGNRVGLLHDPSEGSQRVFGLGAQGDSSYIQAQTYLKSLQGNGVQNFLNGLPEVPEEGGGSATPAPSRARFLANMQIVKTLYSPSEGVIRHLILVSAGPESFKNTASAQAKFDSLFADRPISVGGLRGADFAQAGFDLSLARAAHPIPGETFSDGYADYPGFSSMTVYATVRNAAKGYDFRLNCTGGRSFSCGHLEFHGKAATPWSDSVEWEAYRNNGQLVGRVKTRPAVMAPQADTSTVRLWAGASGAFSEMKESALGPAYGFVDASASLLALVKDSLSSAHAQAYADTGVPFSGSLSYPGPPSTPATSLHGGTLGGAASWRIERAGADALFIRVPGMAAGAKVEIELVRLDGKSAGTWTLRAEAGALRWNIAGIKPGTYLMRLRGPNLRGERLLTL